MADIQRRLSRPEGPDASRDAEEGLRQLRSVAQGYGLTQSQITASGVFDVAAPLPERGHIRCVHEKHMSETFLGKGRPKNGRHSGAARLGVHLKMGQFSASAFR